MQDADYLRIPLRRRDGSIRAEALVDVDDAHLVESFRWHLGSNGYARRNEGDVPVVMHRALLGLAPGDPMHVDHINRDKLDNRRANLRLATHAQNMQNKSAPVGGVSRFLGVQWDPRKQRWRARVRLNGKRIRLGSYHSEIHAALAVDRWRREHSPFATLDPELAEILRVAADYLDEAA